MDQNINTEQSTQTENMGNETDVQETAKKEKLFTQEEVNGFIQSRIGRMKEQAAKEAETAFAQRVADLEARERKLLLKERLSERGMPRELVDIINGTDEKDIDAKLDALQKIYGNKEKENDSKSTGFIRMGAYGEAEQPSVDPVRKAMKLD